MMFELIEFKVKPVEDDMYRHIVKYLFNGKEFQVNVEYENVAIYNELLITILKAHDVC